MYVVPYIGTWIETRCHQGTEANRKVVPYIGTWIETGLFGSIGAGRRVVPYIGTWIETIVIYVYRRITLSYLI